jgi:hypothetical chaperone protein
VRGAFEVIAPRWIGVDFGTTNSAVATIDEAGAPQLVTFPSAAGRRPTFPSVLYFDRRSPSVAGSVAIERYLASDTKGLIQSLKPISPTAPSRARRSGPVATRSRS